MDDLQGVGEIQQYLFASMAEYKDAKPYFDEKEDELHWYVITHGLVYGQFQSPIQTFCRIMRGLCPINMPSGQCFSCTQNMNKVTSSATSASSTPSLIT